MKRLLWFSARDEKPVIELVLSIESARWLADHIPRADSAREELDRVILECLPTTEPT